VTQFINNPQAPPAEESIEGSGELKKGLQRDGGRRPPPPGPISEREQASPAKYLAKSQPLEKAGIRPEVVEKWKATSAAVSGRRLLSRG
jgi:hypothetical protein